MDDLVAFALKLAEGARKKVEEDRKLDKAPADAQAEARTGACCFMVSRPVLTVVAGANGALEP